MAVSLGGKVVQLTSDMRGKVVQLHKYMPFWGPFLFGCIWLSKVLYDCLDICAMFLNLMIVIKYLKHKVT